MMNLDTVCITWSTKHNIKVQPIDTDWWIIFNTQIDMLLNAKTEVPGCWEIIASQFILTYLEMKLRQKNSWLLAAEWLDWTTVRMYLQTFFQNFFSLRATHGTMNSYLFIATNAKRSNRITCFGKYWLLTGQLFQHLNSKTTSCSLFLDFETEFHHLWNRSLTYFGSSS